MLGTGVRRTIRGTNSKFPGPLHVQPVPLDPGKHSEACRILFGLRDPQRGPWGFGLG